MTFLSDMRGFHSAIFQQIHKKSLNIKDLGNEKTLRKKNMYCNKQKIHESNENVHFEVLIMSFKFDSTKAMGICSKVNSIK